MSTEYKNIYYAITKNGYLLINDNEYDYSQDQLIIDLMKKYKKVIIGDAFNQSIDFIPDCITHLQLGCSFNKPIMNLPRSLKYLMIAATQIAYCDFNQSLDYLPEDLESLTMKLTSNFTMPINNLPQRLKHLYFICKNFRHPINNLPEGLESLVISHFDYANTYKLPITLNEVKILSGMYIEDKENITKNLIQKFPNIKFQMNC